MEANRTMVCKRCGGPTGPDDDVTNQSSSDPLVVSECARCHSIVDIGGHRW
ncbi:MULTISPECIES: hypothetical protein [Halorubrum]|uniref:Small CPxCG-related zinc finger protein n=1 Tax=Halorubrum sodomense TaxID=35743 RepID=A0A1I6FK19_HALSD|nr:MULTISPECIES: hypothetical protein [Halorubrum]SFR30224.1 hypothetical protein SAMN04487937_0040 [Halorubrum sodomense]